VQEIWKPSPIEPRLTKISMMSKKGLGNWTTTKREHLDNLAVSKPEFMDAHAGRNFGQGTKLKRSFVTAVTSLGTIFERPPSHANRRKALRRFHHATRIINA